jgi:light-regulated signal transduction histidine kinase (bacteriophytochrome)
MPSGNSRTKSRARTETEAELARSNQALKLRSHQLDAANQELQAFAYSVSHDLRAPLRGIDGWSLALVEDYGAQLDDTARGYLHTIRGETQTMGRLIEDMLVLSRVTRAELDMRPVDLSALAHTVAERLMRAEPGRRIEFDIQPGLTATGDAHLLEIALTQPVRQCLQVHRHAKHGTDRVRQRIQGGSAGAASHLLRARQWGRF